MICPMVLFPVTLCDP